MELSARFPRPFHARRRCRVARDKRPPASTPRKFLECPVRCAPAFFTSTRLLRAAQPSRLPKTELRAGAPYGVLDQRIQPYPTAMGTDMDVRRYNALVRDSRGLDSVLDQLDSDDFDRETKAALVRSAEDLLETLTVVAHDHEFWAQLRTDPRGTTAEQRDRLRGWQDGTLLALILKAGGWVEPPPPPARQLADEAATAMEQALLSGTTHHRLVDTAQQSLIYLMYRARKQIAFSFGGAKATHKWALSLADQAHQMLPIAAGTAAGVLVEAMLGGSTGGAAGIPLGMLVSSAVLKDLSEEAAQTATSTGLDFARRVAAARGAAADEPRSVETDFSLGDLLSTHTISVLSTAGDLLSSRRNPPTAAERSEAAGSILRHARRIKELVDDFGAHEDAKAAADAFHEAGIELELAALNGVSSEVFESDLRKVKCAAEEVIHICGLEDYPLVDDLEDSSVSDHYADAHHTYAGMSDALTIALEESSSTTHESSSEPQRQAKGVTPPSGEEDSGPSSMSMG